MTSHLYSPDWSFYVFPVLSASHTWVQCLSTPSGREKKNAYPDRMNSQSHWSEGSFLLQMKPSQSSYCPHPNSWRHIEKPSVRDTDSPLQSINVLVIKTMINREQLNVAWKTPQLHLTTIFMFSIYYYSLSISPIIVVWLCTEEKHEGIVFICL